MDVALGVKADTHVDQVRTDIQNVGNHLRHRCLMTLTLWDRADGYDDFAINVELGAGGLRVAGKRRLRIDDLRLPEIIGA